MTEADGNSLPASWIECYLGDVLLDIVGGGTPSKDVAEYFQGDIPLMTVKDMKERRPKGTGFNITADALADSSARMIPADTVIIATRMGLGKVVRASFDTAINQDLKALLTPPELDRSYLEFWLMSVASKIESMGTGTTVKGVRLSAVRGLEFPLAPLNEQRRIVEKIETLFARLDKGEEAVREVQKLLTRHRQSVLKAAVTGQLTADWRATCGEQPVDGKGYFDQILKTRQEKCLGRFRVPVEPQLTLMPSLPKGWCWASLDALVYDGPTNGVSPKAAEDGSGVKSFKLTATTSGRFIIDENTIKLVTAVIKPESKYWLKTGDVLIQRGNTIEYVGTAAIFPGPDDEYIYPDLMMRLRFTDDLLARWSTLWINFEFAKRYFRANATGTAGNMPKINGTTLKALAVPLPPRSEIEACLARVEDAFAKSDPVADFCTTELKRSASLRKSILKDAFAGRLVPQDPADEPASDLLARITEEKTPTKKAHRKVQA